MHRRRKYICKEEEGLEVFLKANLAETLLWGREDQGQCTSFRTTSGERHSQWSFGESKYEMGSNRTVNRATKRRVQCGHSAQAHTCYHSTTIRGQPQQTASIEGNSNMHTIIRHTIVQHYGIKRTGNLARHASAVQRIATGQSTRCKASKAISWQDVHATR